MSIKQNLEQIKRTIPDVVTLVAVSKTKPVEAVLEAYQSGQRIFGENKVQELLIKYEALPKDIEWHLIGHLQTNKVKYVVPFVSLIHSIDSLKLLEVVNDCAKKCNRVVKVLLQLHIAKEETKFGLNANEATEIVKQYLDKKFTNVRIVGLMGMATFSDDEKLVRSEFSELKKIFQDIRSEYLSLQNSFCILSMGMSDDYLWAIDEGSTMVRVGTSIFGSRKYNNGFLHQ